jgi:hypothetical protein
MLNSGNNYNQKFGKIPVNFLLFSSKNRDFKQIVENYRNFSYISIPPYFIILLFRIIIFTFLVFFLFLVNPIASHFHNAPQQNLTQNYSLPASTLQANSFDASSSFHNPPAVNNFNNFDQSKQFPMQYQQQQSFDYQAGGHIQQQQQFMGQSSVNNGSSSAYQHSINDLLVQPTATLQQNLFSSSQDSSGVAVNQFVS